MVSAINDDNETVSEAARNLWMQRRLMPSVVKDMIIETWRDAVDRRLTRIKSLHAWARVAGQFGTRGDYRFFCEAASRLLREMGVTLSWIDRG